MSRTRIVFFSVVAIFLVLIAAGLGAEVVNPQLVRQLFVAATIFAAGVVLLDVFGLLGHHSDATDPVVGGHEVGDHGMVNHGGSAPAGHNGGVDTGGHSGDGSAHYGGEHADQGSAHAGGHEGDHPQHAQHNSQSDVTPIISVLAYLRQFVYFCLGFGPVGWAAMSTGRSALTSLAMAAPVGIGAVLLAQAFFRFQRKDTDSQIMPDELIARVATVIVPLDASNMGKVRVKVGMSVEDLYALADEADRRFDKGESVRIARITDECVYVR